MSNLEYEGVTVTGRTYRTKDKSTLLVIPEDLAKHLQIENSKVSMSLLDDFSGNKHLALSKYYHEITSVEVSSRMLLLAIYTKYYSQLT